MSEKISQEQRYTQEQLLTLKEIVKDFLEKNKNYYHLCTTKHGEPILTHMCAERFYVVKKDDLDCVNNFEEVGYVKNGAIAHDYREVIIFTFNHMGYIYQFQTMQRVGWLNSLTKQDL